MGQPFAMPGDWGALDDFYPTFPQKLKEKGYKTSIFGISSFISKIKFTTK